ncbi:MAG: hypothetical protein ACR2O1_00770 [Boseongicola sp.]
MAEKAAKSENVEPGVVNLQDDDRWQQRLAEARERRAQSLKEMGRDDKALRKPRKPWEEEADGGHQSAAAAPAVFKKKYDFLDRVNTLKRVTGRETDLNDLEPRPGRNWYPGADENPGESAPSESAPSEMPSQESREEVEDVRDRIPIDNIFDDPNFGTDDNEPVISLLLDTSEPMPPTRTSRPWLHQEIETAEDDTRKAASKEKSATTRKETNTSKKWGLPRWLGLVVLLLIAMSPGPLSVYVPWQAKATGPSSPIFGLQPALGLTSPLVGIPLATSAADWSPVSDVPPSGPLRVLRIQPPEFARRVGSPKSLPQSRGVTVGFELAAAATSNSIPLRSSPAGPRLTLSMFERIGGDPTQLIALPPVLAGVSLDAISPVSRPDVTSRVQ